MAVSVVNTWQASISAPAGYVFPQPAGASATAAVANTTGNWLVAVATWQSPAEFTTTMAFGDDAGNHWVPLGAPVGTSSAAGNVRCAVWAAPYAMAASRVSCCPSDWCPAFAVLILEVAGMGPGLSLQAVNTSYANAATSASASLPAPAVQALAIAVAGSDLNTATVTMSGPGWTALPVVASTDGSGHLADITLTSGWQVTSGAVSASWSSTAALDLGACAVAVAVTRAAPSGPSQGWPHVQFEAAFGAGIGTPWDQLTWTDLTARYRGLSGQRGKQYELDSVQASSMQLILSNNDGALTPGYAGSPYNLGLSGWTGRGNATLALSRDYAWTGPASMLMAPDGVTAGTAAESAQCPVIPSTSGYSGSAAVYSPQGWASVTAAIKWHTSGGSLISTSTGTAVTAAAGQWCYPQVSASSPGTAAFGTLYVAATGTPPSATLFWVDACYLLSPAGAVLNGNPVFAVGPDVYVPARRKAAWQGRTYVDWRGFIERWPSQMSGSRYTTANATATDVYAGLTSLQPAVAAGEILIDDPWGYWQCADAAGSTSAANVGPGSAGPLAVVTSKFGPGPTGAYAFGGSTTAMPGAPSGCWTQSGLNSGSTDIQHGYCLQLQATTTPPVSAGLTIEAWHEFTGVQPNGKLVIWALQGASGPVAELYGDYDGSGAGVGWYLAVTDKGTRAVTATRVFAFGIETVGWVHFAVALTQTAWQLYISGGAFTPTVASGTCNLAPSFQWVTFGGSADRVSTGGMSNISLAGLAIYPRALPQTRVVAHVLAASDGLAEELTPGRVNRLLSYAGMLVPRRPAGGSDNMQPATDIQGQAAAQNLTNIAQSDSGLLYVDRSGYLALDNRASRWNRAVAWDVGENAGGYLNANWDFEAGISPWTGHNGAGGASGVTLAQSAALAWSGSSSMSITPGGSTAGPGAQSEVTAVTAGGSVTGSAWLYCPTGYSTGAHVAVDWFNASGGFISGAVGTTIALAAGQWTQVTASGTAPAGTAGASLVITLNGTPPSSAVTYADQALLALNGEIPYLTDVAPGFDPSQVFNDLAVTQYQGITIALANPTSIAQYGDLTLQETAYLANADTVTDLANWILASYGIPLTRVQFTVDAKANPYAWQFVLSADVGTVILASRRLQGTQPVIQAQFVIQSVSLSNAPGQWQVTYVATPYYLGALATNDPVRGLPNGLNPIAFLRRR